MFRSASELAAYADGYEEMMAECDIQEKAEDDKERIRIMTYHASKGLEFDTVILPHLKREAFRIKKAAALRRRKKRGACSMLR